MCGARDVGASSARSGASAPGSRFAAARFMTRSSPDSSAATVAGNADDTLAAGLFAEAQSHARAGDVGAARQRLPQSARGGHLPAQWQLGLWDLIGLGAAVDVPAAVARLRDAAGRGHLPAVVLPVGRRRRGGDAPRLPAGAGAAARGRAGR
ncbi:MAG: hypothetical protein ACK5WT_05155 [Betaproteobacteria bacterium]